MLIAVIVLPTAAVLFAYVAFPVTVKLSPEIRSSAYVTDADVAAS